MTLNEVAGLVGGGVGILIVVFIVSMLALGYCVPFMMFSATRSLRKIARELERQNDYREHYERGARPAAIGEPSRARL